MMQQEVDKTDEAKQAEVAPTNEPFMVKDCALIAIATGVRAQDLRELGMHLETIHPGCIYYHFWGGRLRARFQDPEYQNDFAAWARHGLHDRILAERLALIDPTQYDDLQDLRRELIEVIEERAYESEMINFINADSQFSFIRSQIVVFDTGARVSNPKDLGLLIPALPASSIFFHFIDARRRSPMKRDDFSHWLTGFNGKYKDLERKLADLDPYFVSLPELRDQVAEQFSQFMQKV